MAAPFFAMAGVHWLALAMLYVGLVLAWLASSLYVRSGLKELTQASS
jgi:heme exporter protein D